MNDGTSRASCWIRAIALFILFPWLTTCDGNAAVPGENGPPYFDHADFDAVAIDAAVVSAAPSIGKPSLLRLSNGVLWIADMAGDPGLHALDAATGTPIVSVGRRGEGPGEFARSPFTLSVAPQDSAAVWAFDLALQRLSRFDVRSVKDEVPVMSLQGTPSILRIVWVSRDRLVGQSNSKDARFSIFSPDGRRERTVPGVLLGTEQQSEGLRLNVTNNALQICEWPGRGFALVYFFAGRVELYDPDATLVRVANVPYPSEPAFETDPAGKPRVSTDRQWYIDCSATSDHLFALFSGRQKRAFPGDAAFSGTFVHVFDWAGTLQTVLSLDRDVRAIAVDPARGELYASSLVDAGIYRYVLPTLDAVHGARTKVGFTTPNNAQRTIGGGEPR